MGILNIDALALQVLMFLFSMPFVVMFTPNPWQKNQKSTIFIHCPSLDASTHSQVSMLVNLPLVVGERILSAPMAASARCILATEMGPSKTSATSIYKAAV